MISDEEKGYIRCRWRDARDKIHQVTIEAEIYGTTKAEIVAILGIESANKELEDLKKNLYNQGYTDKMMADALGLKPHSIACWRNKNALPQAGTVYVFVDKAKRYAVFLEAYLNHLSDKQIAIRAGCSKSAVCGWRLRHNLPCISSIHQSK